jgi:hypothetical protein
MALTLKLIVNGDVDELWRPDVMCEGSQGTEVPLCLATLVFANT